MEPGAGPLRDRQRSPAGNPAPADGRCGAVPLSDRLSVALSSRAIWTVGRGLGSMVALARERRLGDRYGSARSGEPNPCARGVYLGRVTLAPGWPETTKGR